jgi:hypothetical protein
MCIGGRHLPFIIIYGKWSINNQHPAISVKSAKNMNIYPNGLRTCTSTYAWLKFPLGNNGSCWFGIVQTLWWWLGQDITEAPCMYCFLAYISAAILHGRDWWTSLLAFGQAHWCSMVEDIAKMCRSIIRLALPSARWAALCRCRT